MERQTTQYVFVTGGVLSGLGKGITAASIGNILKARGLRVNLQKCDPYLNVDAGTLNPREHGECFVTRDGAETDLDLGHYERFIDEELTTTSSLMSGRVLLKLIEDERAGKYKGEDVQIIPHLTAAIQGYIQAAGKGFDVHIVEIGGTVGDLESQAFIEAIREFGLRVGLENCLYVHVVYMPYLGASHETKTKPAQNSVRDLRGMGVTPNILVARSEAPVTNKGVSKKLSLFCGVEEEAIALLPNAKSIYQVPLTLEETGIGEIICKKLGLETEKPDMRDWQDMVTRAMKPKKKKLKVGVVAKYMDNQDTYMSVFEALRAAAWKHSVDIEIKWIEAEELEKKDDISAEMEDVAGVVLPGGFGTRGLEGKIKAAQYCLKNNKPYLGLCLGLQMAVVAAVRNAGLANATSEELDSTAEHRVIHTMADQRGKENTGGSMRLGDYVCKIEPGSLSAKLYGATEIVERHRHRYEVNNEYKKYFEQAGLHVVGTSPNGNLVEMVEAKNHPFFVATQAHPEFKSRPDRAHPLFDGFIASASDVPRRD